MLAVEAPSGYRGNQKTGGMHMKPVFRFVLIVAMLLSAALVSVSSAGPIWEYCTLHPTAPICQGK
jgi:hypothetical protein